MSTIPKGLRADYMRQRMEDKATITSAGGIYVGRTAITLHGDRNGNTSGTITAYETDCQPLGGAGLPLVSNGTSGGWPYLSYKALGTAGVADNAINYAKLGAGTVVSPNNNKKKVFDAYMDGDILIITYYDA